jgi:hypothetical protein
MEYDPEDLTLLVRSEYIQDSAAKSTDVQYLELRLNDHIAENEERFAALEGVNDKRKVIYKESKDVLRYLMTFPLSFNPSKAANRSSFSAI